MSTVGTVGTAAAGILWGWLLNQGYRQVNSTGWHRAAFGIIATSLLLLEVTVIEGPFSAPTFVVAFGLGAAGVAVRESRLKQLMVPRRESC